MVFAVHAVREAFLEELADARSRLEADVVFASREDRCTAEGAVLVEEVTDARVANGGDFIAAIGLQAHLARPKQARNASLHNVRGVAVGRTAEVGEERCPAESPLGFDVLLNAACHDAAAGRDIAS